MRRAGGRKGGRKGRPNKRVRAVAQHQRSGSNGIWRTESTSPSIQAGYDKTTDCIIGWVLQVALHTSEVYFMRGVGRRGVGGVSKMVVDGCH